MSVRDILVVLNVVFATLAVMGFISFFAYNAGVKRAKKDYKKYFEGVK